MPFITVDAATARENNSRPAHVNIDSICYVAAAGNIYDADGHAAIYFRGGLGTSIAPLVTLQTAAQVKALIDAALAG